MKATLENKYSDERDWRVVIPLVFALTILGSYFLPWTEPPADLSVTRSDEYLENIEFELQDSSPPLFTFSRIAINDADAELLQTVKGVGPRLAADIISYREEYGDFSGPESLQNITGVGERRARYLSTQFSFE